MGIRRGAADNPQPWGKSTHAGVFAPQGFVDEEKDIEG